MKPSRLLIIVALAGSLAAGNGCQKQDSAKEREAAPGSSAGRLDPASPLMPALPKASGKAHAVGETALGTFYKMRVEKVQECKVREYFAPAAGNIKLGVEVTLEGTEDKDVPVNPFYARVTDSEGISWTSTLAGCMPDLKSMRINTGDTVTGWITFELPKSATGLKLTYAPFIVGAAKHELVFELGR